MGKEITEIENIQHVKSILNKVSVLRKSDTEIRKATGARYNLFQILKVQRNELKHSLIIGDLLNPKGKHDQGDEYLKLFIEVVLRSINSINEDGDEKSRTDEFNNALKILSEFNTKQATVLVETDIGVINEVEGGRIDILLKSKGKYIIIENKVDANDQRSQLLRYKNYKGTDSIVLYLNKFGDLPDESSYTTEEYKKTKPQVKVRKDGKNIHLNINEDYFIITFKHQIKGWVEKCIEISNNKPYIRENLNQYLEIVQKITKQLNSNYMDKELTEYFMKNENINKLDDAKLLSKYMNGGKIYEELVGKKVFSIAVKIAEELGFKLENVFNNKKGNQEYYNNKWSNYDSGEKNKILLFRPLQLTYFSLSYKPDNSLGYSDFSFVLRNRTEKDLSKLKLNGDENMSSLLKNKFGIDEKKIDLKAVKDGILFIKSFDEYSNLESSQSIKAIDNGKFKESLINHLSLMLTKAIEIEKEIQP
jgi:hypothetical protein